MAIMVKTVITITMTIKSKNNRILKKTLTNNCTKARCKMSKRFLLFTVFHLNERGKFHKCNYKNYQNNFAITFTKYKKFLSERNAKLITDFRELKNIDIKNKLIPTKLTFLHIQ